MLRKVISYVITHAHAFCFHWTKTWMHLPRGRMSGGPRSKFEPHRGASGSTILMATEIISLDSSDEDEATTLAEKLAARAAVPAALQSSSKARGKRKAVIEEDSDDENSGQASPQRAVRRPRTAPPLGSAAAQKRTMVIEEDSDDEPLPVGGSSERAEAVAAAKEPTVAAAPAPSARKEPTAAAISAYQRSRASGVKARVFPLDKLPASNTISTGRTIKPISGWHGMWPPIREFFQNTIDHLDLRKEGGLHPALTRSVSRDAAGRTRIEAASSSASSSAPPTSS